LDFFHETKSTLISDTLSIFLQAEIFGVTWSLNLDHVPTHFPSVSLYPLRQVQVYDPSVLVQVALASHVAF
jgi:hypothetical protein